MFVPVLCHAKFEWLIAQNDEEAFCASLKSAPRIDPMIHALPDDFVLKSVEIAAAPRGGLSPGRRIIRPADVIVNSLRKYLMETATAA